MLRNGFILYLICSKPYLNADPCDRIQCTATNTICEIIFATGTPNCVCPLGMKGDPKIGCGKYVNSSQEVEEFLLI